MQMAVLRSCFFCHFVHIVFLSFRMLWLDISVFHQQNLASKLHPYIHESTSHVATWRCLKKNTVTPCHFVQHKVAIFHRGFLCQCGHKMSKKKHAGGGGGENVNGPSQYWWKLGFDTAPVSVLRCFFSQKKTYFEPKNVMEVDGFFADFPDFFLGWFKKVNFLNLNFQG